MSRILHIWFDVDNTLYMEPPKLKMDRMQHMYSSLAQLVGCTVDEIIPIYDGVYKKNKRHSDAFAEFNLGPEVSTRKYSNFDASSYLVRDQRLIDLVDKLDNRTIPYSIHTNNSRVAAARILYRLGLVPLVPGAKLEPLLPLELVDKNADEGIDLSRFAFILASDRYHKSAPGVFRELVSFSKARHEQMKHMGVVSTRFSPSRVLYAGDREPVELVPASQEGMTTVLVLHGESRPRETKADYVIPDIYCLDGVIERIESLEDSDVSS